VKLLSKFFITKYALLRKKSLFLSGCKINQNMEFGDIIYFILLVFFMILGFFNDSKKKKDKQEQQPEEHSRPYFDVPEEDIPPRWLEPNVLKKNQTTSPPPPVSVVEEGRTAFQSSMDLTTDFAKESSLKSSIFVYDADVSYDKDADTQDIAEMSDSYLQKTADGEKRSSPHPLIGDLYGDAGREELMKGLIIGEIMQRKY